MCVCVLHKTPANNSQAEKHTQAESRQNKRWHKHNTPCRWHRRPPKHTPPTFTCKHTHLTLLLSNITAGGKRLKNRPRGMFCHMFSSRTPDTDQTSNNNWLALVSAVLPASVHRGEKPDWLSPENIWSRLDAPEQPCSRPIGRHRSFACRRNGPAHGLVPTVCCQGVMAPGRDRVAIILLLSLPPGRSEACSSVGAELCRL